MSEEKTLNTKTDISIVSGNISIFTYFIDGLKSLRAFFSSTQENLDGVIFQENDLGFKNTGYEDLIFYLNNKGELLVESDENKDFSINENGELIMEEPI